MKIQKAAAVYFEGQAGREQEFCDRLSERFRDLAERAGVSNSCFMRTTMPEHKEVVKRVWVRSPKPNLWDIEFMVHFFEHSGY